MIEYLHQYPGLPCLLFGLGGGFAVVIATELVKTGLENLRPKSVFFKVAFVLAAGIVVSAAHRAKPDLNELNCLGIGAFWPYVLVALKGAAKAVTGGPDDADGAAPPGAPPT